MPLTRPRVIATGVLQADMTSSDVIMRGRCLRQNCSNAVPATRAFFRTAQKTAVCCRAPSIDVSLSNTIIDPRRNRSCRCNNVFIGPSSILPPNPFIFSSSASLPCCWTFSPFRWVSLRVQCELRKKIDLVSSSKEKFTTRAKSAEGATKF